MSFGSSSAPSAPRLQTVSIPQSENLLLSQDVSQYALSDADWAARFPGFSAGRSDIIGQLGGELGGGIPSQATGALNTAGLGAEASRMQGANEFQTARNEGQPILAKEQRDRNYASTLLAMNPQRSFGLNAQDVLDIVTSNTGNVNAYKQAIFGSQSNAAISSSLQSAQDFSALTSLLGAGAKVGANYYSSPYTSPFASPYYSYGNSQFAGSQGVGFDAAGDPVGGY